MRAFLVLATALALTLHGSEGAAQQPAPRSDIGAHPAIVQGRILGPDKKAIEGAEILIGDSLSDVTDRRGRFELDPVAPGVHDVLVRKLGLVPLRFRIAVTAGDIWDGTITMDRSAQTLPAVMVLDSARALKNFRPRWIDGFVDRRRMGLGTFLDRVDIERLHAVRTAYLIGRAAGIGVREGFGYDILDVSRCGAGMGGGGKAIVFVDGLKTETSTNGRFMSLAEVPPEILLGVEIYRGQGSVPPQYSDPQACLVILLWTRHR
jgi:hypothetical protein